MSSPENRLDALVDPARLPAGAAAIIALCFTFRFRSYLPIPQGWADLEKLWFPLSALNLVFHEAGHWILGIFGIDFLRVAGGTIMQLAMPSACLVHFWTRENYAGVVAVIFWVGINLVEISYYAADAKMQVLILITGMSGSEGGGHDWGYMLDRLGLTNSCIGIGQLMFFLGCWCMAFPPLAGLFFLWNKWRKTDLPTPGT